MAAALPHRRIARRFAAPSPAVVRDGPCRGLGVRLRGPSLRQSARRLRDDSAGSGGRTLRASRGSGHVDRDGLDQGGSLGRRSVGREPTRGLPRRPAVPRGRGSAAGHVADGAHGRAVVTILDGRGPLRRRADGRRPGDRTVPTPRWSGSIAPALEAGLASWVAVALLILAAAWLAMRTAPPTDSFSEESRPVARSRSVRLVLSFLIGALVGLVVSIGCIPWPAAAARSMVSRVDLGSHVAASCDGRPAGAT
jgi:hypothetical protein